MPDAIDTVPGMPPVVDPRNLYSETEAGRLSPGTAGALSRIYVPNRQSNNVSVVDAESLMVFDVSAARRPVLGSADALGREQWRSPRRRKFNPLCSVQ